MQRRKHRTNMNRQTKLVLGIIGGTVFILLSLYLFLRRQQDSDISIMPPAPPRDVTPAPLPPLIPSTIAVRATLPIEDLENLAASALDDYLRNPIHRKNDSMEYSVTLRLREITMKGVEGSLQEYSSAEKMMEAEALLTFNGWARVSKQIFGKTIQKREDVTGNAIAKLELDLTFNPDWSVTATAHSDFLIQQAAIEILGLTVSIRRPLTKLIKELVLPKLETKIVKYISQIEIKSRVSSLWARLYEPIVVNSVPPIFLSIEPLEILAQQPSSDAEQLYLHFGIKTYIQANIGDEPPILRDVTYIEIAPTEDREEEKRAIPDLHFVDSLESGYRITAPLLVTYTTIEQLARPHVEKAHRLKGIETLVDSLTIYGSQTKLVAGLSFQMPKFRANGQVYLLGTPHYNPGEMTLSVTDFDYTLTTRNLLVEMAENIGGSAFPHLREEVESKLVFSLEERLTLLREKLQTAIENRAVGSYIRLHGTVDTITPEALYLTPEGIRIPVRLEGELHFEVKLDSSGPSDQAAALDLIDEGQAALEQSDE